ncbi:hypothetical protein [Rhodococcus sp. NPDC004095]
MKNLPRELNSTQAQALDKVDKIVGEAMEQAQTLIRENFDGEPNPSGRRCLRCSNCSDFQRSSDGLLCRRRDCGHHYASHDIY